MTGPDRPEQPVAGSSTPPAWQRFLPAATFLVGLLLGSVLVAASQSRDSGPSAAGDDSATSSSTSGPTPTSTVGDTVVTLPAACEESAVNLREATALLGESVDSVKDFDPQRLVEILNRLETLDNETRPLVDECSAVTVTSSPTSPASPTSDDTATGTATPTP